MTADGGWVRHAVALQPAVGQCSDDYRLKARVGASYWLTSTTISLDAHIGSGRAAEA